MCATLRFTYRAGPTTGRTPVAGWHRTAAPIYNNQANTRKALHARTGPTLHPLVLKVSVNAALHFGTDRTVFA